MSTPEPSLSTHADYLHAVEEFLEMYGRGLEWRTRFNALAFLAQQISLDPEQYVDFGDALREASNEPKCRLNIVFNKHSGALAFVGIKATFAPEDWGSVKGSSVDRQMAEEAQAKYYLALFDISKLKAQAEKLHEEAGEARAAVRLERDRADTAEKEVHRHQLELSRLKHVKATDEDVRRLQGELDALQRRYSRLEEESAKLTLRLTQAGEAFRQYREGREHHICEVGGLRLLKTLTCKCLILADHRRCEGVFHMLVTKDTSLNEAAVRILRPEPGAYQVTSGQVSDFYAEVGGQLDESLHISLAPDPNIERLRPGRIAMKGHVGGSRNLRRSIYQLSNDPRPEQRSLSTYTVRVGES